MTSMTSSSSTNITYSQLFSGKRQKRLVDSHNPDSFLRRENVLGIVDVATKGAYEDRTYNNGKYGATLNESGVVDSIKTNVLGTNGKFYGVCFGLAWNGKYFMGTHYAEQRVYFFDHNANLVEDEYGNTYRHLGGGPVNGAAWDGSLFWTVSPFSNANIKAYNFSGPDVVLECSFDIPGDPAVYNIGYAKGLLYVVTKDDTRLLAYRWEGGNNMKEIYNVDLSTTGISNVQGITYDGQYLWMVGSSILRCDLDGTNTYEIPLHAIEGDKNYGGWTWTGKNIVAVNWNTWTLVALNVEKNTVYADRLEVQGDVFSIDNSVSIKYGTVPPTIYRAGTLWYDSNASALKMYNGSTWVSV